MIRVEGKSFTKDGKPFFPVIGEYQYSRSFRCDYDKDMKKMKALGVNAIATYSFWIHHEEIEDKFDFSGNKDIRFFLETAKRNNLLVSLRLGPWVHGECRNGGFPDWIYSKNCRLRSNDPIYLKYVRRYFEALYKQCEGYMEKDGGPVFAIQIENEYAQWGRQDESYGDVHMNKLEAMLKEIGFDVPIYLATGWGDAATGNALPVYGAYAAAPWEGHVDKLPPMEGYIFSPNPNDSRIGSDSGIKKVDLSKKTKESLYATIELGTGIEATRLRRPLLSPKDNAALVLTRLGSGVAALGYYVFHGGIHPDGKLSSTQEYRRESNLDAGFYCDLAEKDYDFQAAISNYGEVREGGKLLHVYNVFASEFASTLLSSSTIFPIDNAKDPVDLDSPRYSFKMNGDSGFLFINTYVRGYEVKQYPLSRYASSLNINYPNIDIPLDTFGILPINMKIGHSYVRFGLVSPYMVLNNKDAIFINTFGIDYLDIDKNDSSIFILSLLEASHCYKAKKNNEEFAIITDDEIYIDNEEIHLEGNDEARFKIYPDKSEFVPNSTRIGNDGLWGIYSKKYLTHDIKFELNELDKEGDKKVFKISFPSLPKEGNARLEIPFEGDLIEIFKDGKKIDDRFYTGLPYCIYLKQWGNPSSLIIKVKELKEETPIYLDKKPEFKNGVACKLGNIEVKHIKDIIL